MQRAALSSTEASQAFSVAYPDIELPEGLHTIAPCALCGAVLVVRHERGPRSMPEEQEALKAAHGLHERLCRLGRARPTPRQILVKIDRTQDFVASLAITLGLDLEQ